MNERLLIFAGQRIANTRATDIATMTHRVNAFRDLCLKFANKGENAQDIADCDMWLAAAKELSEKEEATP